MQIVTYANRRLVRRHRGTMPIILTSPRGGAESPANVSVRSRSATPDGCQFKTGGDTGTAELTELAAQRILDMTARW
jgi:hypothetical protein